jgi:enoyl-CoA hydratase/carnithine racemase
MILVIRVPQIVEKKCYNTAKSMGKAEALSLLIKSEIRENFGLITIARPEKANAYTDKMIGRMHELLSKMIADANVRVIVIKGANGYFCSGADLSEIKERTLTDAMDLPSVRFFDALATCPKPTIAAIDGAAVAGGLELALACDLRISTPRSRFALPETALGLLPAAGGLWRLPELVGPSMARRMILFGEEPSPEQALEIGLVDELVDPDTLLERVKHWVDKAAARDALGLRLAKTVLDTSMPANAKSRLTAWCQGVLYDRRKIRIE